MVDGACEIDKIRLRLEASNRCKVDRGHVVHRCSGNTLTTSWPLRSNVEGYKVAFDLKTLENLRGQGSDKVARV